MDRVDERIVEIAVVTDEDLPCRLDRFVSRHFAAWPSRAGARKAVKRGEVAVDGELLESGRWLAAGQQVQLLEPEGRRPRSFELPLRVVFEDEHLAVVEKVPGFPVNGPRHRTIEHALPGNLAPSAAPDALRWPRPAHRLDAPTGGLLLCAKTRSALAGLGRALQQREVTKRYRALLVGRLEGEGEVDSPLEGRAARSRYRAVDWTPALRGEWITTVDLWPLTGRTHQLRRHVSELGHPVLGDVPYGLPGLTLRGKGLFLWAVEVRLRHPLTGAPLAVTIEEPPKFGSVRAREARRHARATSTQPP